MTNSTSLGNSQAGRPEPFQFRILDLLVITTLLGLFAGAVAQQSPGLFLLFIAAGFLSILFVWKKVTPFKVLLGIAGVLLLIALLLPAIDGGLRPVGQRTSCGNNLKQIVWALHNYHDIYGTFPPAYIADASGKPMHSWRVLILPFIEQKVLYDKYKFDEPWDGPNNRKLADTIMRAYSCPSQHNKAGSSASFETNYVVVIGDHTAWPGDKALTLGDFADGTANTILVVEVHNSGIHWMEPRDLHITQMARAVNAPHGQGISSAHQGGAQVGMADGAIKFVPEKTPADVLRSRLQIDDGTLADPMNSW